MIIDRCRDEKELYNLYKARPMPEGRNYSFDFLINNPYLFCFYDEKEGFLRGFITIQSEDGELTLSGTSIRKNMPDNVQAIIKICNAFKQDMYSYTPLKHAALVLKKAGFKHVKDDKYIRIYKNE